MEKDHIVDISTEKFQLNTLHEFAFRQLSVIAIVFMIMPNIMYTVIEMPTVLASQAPSTFCNPLPTITWTLIIGPVRKFKNLAVWRWSMQLNSEGENKCSCAPRSLCTPISSNK